MQKADNDEYPEDEPKGTVQIVLNDSDNPTECKNFLIKVDGKPVCRTGTLPRAYKLMVACHYVFNYAYPKCLSSTMTFVQKVILNHQDKVKKDTKVLNLFSRIVTKK